MSERPSQTGKDVWLISPAGQERQLTSTPDDEFPATVARDGSGVIVVAVREVDGLHREELRWVDDRGQVTLLGKPSGRARNPSLAPDGTWLVAESDAEGFSDLVRIARGPGASSTAVVRLTATPEGDFEPSVSPDGKSIAFVSSRTGNPEIHVMDADGGNVRQLTAFHKEDWAPVWSRDGQWIAFLSTREGRARVFVVRRDGTDMRPVSGAATAPDGEERDIAWHPDSQRLAFVARQPDGRTRIWLASMDGKEPVTLTDGQKRDDQPAWSPDGKYLVFVSEQAANDGTPGDSELFLMRADGSARTQLTHSPGADWLPRWR